MWGPVGWLIAGTSITFWLTGSIPGASGTKNRFILGQLPAIIVPKILDQVQRALEARTAKPEVPLYLQVPCLVILEPRRDGYE